MGKGRPRAVEKGVLGGGSQGLNTSSFCLSPSSSSSSSPTSLHVPAAPVFHPSEEEFRDPLEYICKIRDQAEPYGICKIVPPKSWAPPFALDLDSFSFPTKTQAIHQLQARTASCDSKTFELEYGRFLEKRSGKKKLKLKLKKRLVFEGEDLDLCKLFNAVKRFRGYDKVVKEKKWGEVARFVVGSGRKVSECAKHVLSQLYREHLYDYEKYHKRLNRKVNMGGSNKEAGKICLKKEAGNTSKRRVREEEKSEDEVQRSSKRRKNVEGKKAKVDKVVEEEVLDQICGQCRSGLHGEVMLLCDRCNKGWHIYCLSPPLTQIPQGNWYCFECLNSDKDAFGFVPGKQFTVDAFRRLADRAKRKWVGSGSTSRVQLEKKFWEIVEGLAGEVEVMYGSDIDTSIYGSGFPRLNDRKPESVDAKVWGEYCASPWNLNNLPKLKGSMLQAVHQNITGVMVPWLYVGMLFSSFCWHFEDHCFYSMNYLHWGEPKCWYSVPGSEANAFEKVMRNSLPDLFDAQPDLLFQLVTMLNPSVLQQNGVPVYTVLQEPGNFVITFPRSYHGGFNFGLNCAEAVNFAPADWLPHGGFAAELYQTYRKAAVLCHEELLCVVAKGDCNSKVSPHLKKELLKMFTKEKTWRERLWRSGIIRSSPLPPRKYPEHVGTEEDPTCIICSQYLYLSAVACHCRPSAFVCLEHWQHICECKPSRLRLLYRYTLAELCKMMLRVDNDTIEEGMENKNLQKQVTYCGELNALTKKVKGSLMSMAQLAEEWLLRCSKIFQHPYCGDAYATLLKESEQFVWAGLEMDSVREVAKNLTVAQKWAEDIRGCLAKIEKWSCSPSSDFKRVHMEYINELLKVDPLPCPEPGHSKLKVHAEEARLLIQDIDSALSSCLQISELESLYTRACEFPVFVNESEKLAQKVSLAKVWIESARRCIYDKSCPVDIDSLCKLKSEIFELHVQLPETKLLLDLLSQAELCQARCNEILKSPSGLKDVEMLLQEFENYNVIIPDLVLLKQYYNDAISWTARFSDILVDVHERVDQDNVVNELSCLLKDGVSLKIQVDGLHLLEIELKKAFCRKKAYKARSTKMPMDFLQQLIAEAVILQIDKEKLFVDMSGIVAAGMCWEEKAKKILSHEAQMSDYEDILRSSDDIFLILPLLDEVKDALSMAKSWLKDSESFLVSSSFAMPGSWLKLEALKELVSQSKLLKVALEEKKMLDMVLKKCKEWEHTACSALLDVGSIFDMSEIGDGRSSGLVGSIEPLITRVESIIKAGLSLGFDFPEIPKLQNACSLLQWCHRALTFCSLVPSFEDVENLIEAAKGLSTTCNSDCLFSSLFDGVKWLKRALGVVSLPSTFERCKLSDAQEVLSDSKGKNVSFPVMVEQLVNAIRKHMLWLEQVNEFFSLKPDERTWPRIIEIKEHGNAAAFSCSELDTVLSEVEKVEIWKQRCMEIVGGRVDDLDLSLSALQKIKKSVDISLYIYGKLDCCKSRYLCLCHTGNTLDQEFRICVTCKDCFHLRCLGSATVDTQNAESYVCSYCKFFEDGSTFQDGSSPLRFGGRRPELGTLIQLLSDADNFSIWIEERQTLQQVVDQAIQYKTRLREVLDFISFCLDKDLGVVSDKLTVALKAMEVAGVYDYQTNCELELALARTSWRVRVKRLLDSVDKPALQQIQQHMEEALVVKIPTEDYFRQKLAQLNDIGMKWADCAKKVAVDSGALALERVFDLMLEGENLPVCMEGELKLLKARSMLYCICRKPDDDKAKIVCGLCGEWYHIECIQLLSPPKMFICAACDPQRQRSSPLPLTDHDKSKITTFVEPKTPSPRQTKLRNESKGTGISVTQTTSAISNNKNSKSSHSSGIDRLWWRTRKPFRRETKKRAEVLSLSPFFLIQE